MKKIGKVTTEEKQEIQHLFERRNALKELAKILPADNDDLYEKLIADLGRTNTEFQKWWDNMANKYQWESIDGYQWQIDFETCEIYLVNSSN